MWSSKGQALSSEQHCPPPALQCHPRSSWDPLSALLPNPEGMGPGPPTPRLPYILLPSPSPGIARRREVGWGWPGVRGCCFSPVHHGTLSPPQLPGPWEPQWGRRGRTSSPGLGGGAGPPGGLESTRGRGGVFPCAPFPPLPSSLFSPFRSSISRSET